MLRRTLLTAGLALAGPSLALPSRAWSQDGGLTGPWTAVLTMRGQAFRLRIQFASSGSFLLTSIDQGGQVPGTYTQGPQGDVRFDALAMGARFTGRLEGPDRLVGVWTQRQVDTPLILLRGEAGIAPGSVAPAAPLTTAALTELVVKSQAPGAVIGAQRRGQPVQLWAAGVRQAGVAKAFTAADQVHIGSISKSMLATVVARLVDKGRLNWTDTLGDVLGHQYPAMNPGYQSANFLHLLSHRSGLGGENSAEEIRAFAASGNRLEQQTHTWLTKAFSQAPTAAPGAATSYSNSGYIAAAAMMEARTGRSWRSLMQSELFRPLGLTSAGFGAPGHAGKLDQPIGHGALPGQPWGARPVGQVLDDLPTVLAPAGAVHMTMTDLLTYLAAHRDRTKLLREESWERLHTAPFGGTYALGWGLRPDGGLWHNGSNLLWYAEALIDMKSGVVSAGAVNDGRDPAREPVQVGMTRAVAAVTA